MRAELIGFRKALSLLKEGNYITLEPCQRPFIIDYNHKLYVIREDSFYRLLNDYDIESMRVDFTTYFSLKEELQNK